jgi:homoserine dehydrogenase
MELKLAFIGMGNVGRAFARLLADKRRELAGLHGITWVVTGIATTRHGCSISAEGLDLDDAVRGIESGQAVNALGKGERVSDAVEVIERCSADVLFETTPLNPADGEPAISYIRRALLRGISVVTANKGPVAYGYPELARLAAGRGLNLRFEGSVMDGCPVFNLAQFCLPAARILSFAGILNSTTNLILTGMEEGRSMKESLDEAQRLGIVEADPAHDLDGWDTAIKAMALANVLLGVGQPATLAHRTGIMELKAQDVRAAAAEGYAIRLVARAQVLSGRATITVRPERVPRSSALGCVRGTSNVLMVKTDLMGELGVIENDPGIAQTAYALLSDMIIIHDALTGPPAGERRNGQK